MFHCKRMDLRRRDLLLCDHSHKGPTIQHWPSERRYRRYDKPFPAASKWRGDQPSGNGAPIQARRPINPWLSQYGIDQATAGTASAAAVAFDVRPHPVEILRRFPQFAGRGGTADPVLVPDLDVFIPGGPGTDRHTIVPIIVLGFFHALTLWENNDKSMASGLI